MLIYQNLFILNSHFSFLVAFVKFIQYTMYSIHVSGTQFSYFI